MMKTTLGLGCASMATLPSIVSSKRAIRLMGPPSGIGVTLVQNCLSAIYDIREIKFLKWNMQFGEDIGFHIGDHLSTPEEFVQLGEPYWTAFAQRKLEYQPHSSRFLERD